MGAVTTPWGWGVLGEKAKSIFRNSEEGLSLGEPAEKENRSLNLHITKGEDGMSKESN